MTSLDPKIIMREKGIETAKPIHPASWFRDRRLQIYYRRHLLERMTANRKEPNYFLFADDPPGASHPASRNHASCQRRQLSD
jgi:hypothetical protein